MLGTPTGPRCVKGISKARYRSWSPPPGVHRGMSHCLDPFCTAFGIGPLLVWPSSIASNLARLLSCTRVPDLPVGEPAFFRLLPSGLWLGVACCRWPCGRRLPPAMVCAVCLDRGPSSVVLVVLAAGPWCPGVAFIHHVRPGWFVESFQGPGGLPVFGVLGFLSRVSGLRPSPLFWASRCLLQLGNLSGRHPHFVECCESG